MKTSKRNLSRFLSLVMALAMVVSLAPTAFADTVTPSGKGTHQAATPAGSSVFVASAGNDAGTVGIASDIYTYVARVVGFSPNNVNYDDQVSMHVSVGDTVGGCTVDHVNSDGTFSVEELPGFTFDPPTPSGGGGGGGGGGSSGGGGGGSSGGGGGGSSGGGGGGSDDDDYDEPYYPPDPPHYCTYSTHYQRYSSTQHQAITTSCCGYYSSSLEGHSWRYSYTDIAGDGGIDIHRVTRTCSLCGESDTYTERHTEGSNYRCTKCNRLLAVDITWHYYDEHSPVTTKTKQYYGKGLNLPPVRGRQDYKFTGWYTEWGGVGTQAVQGTKYLTSHPTQYYASWMAIVDLDYDLSAPIITVTRNPVSKDTPSKNITLTITAKDPEGHDHKLPLQIEGETTWHASPYVYTVTEGKPVMIVARDTENNTREFLVNINNLDESKPVIESFTQSTTGWTKDPVKVTVLATDDQALAAQPYQWEFTPNRTGTPTVGAWTATNSFMVNEAGKVRVQVRDAVGNLTWSDYYQVNNVDTTPPSLDPTVPYDVSTTETVAASTGVTITLNLVDTVDSASKLSSGLAAAPIKWVEISGIYSTQRTVTVHQNGTYHVVLKDAVGNESAPIPITISNISTSEPVINRITCTDVDGDVINPLIPGPGDKAPITITVDASFGGAGAPEKPYSYDGGMTWTSLNHFTVNQNGEYTVTIRDANGTQKSSSVILSTVDNSDPLVTMYLYKGQPDDWTTRFPGQACTEADYVWKMYIDAADLGSGIEKIHTHWDNKDYTADQLPIFFDVKEPGTYQVTVTDKAGHETQMEKVVQWTDLSESVYGPNPNVPVTQPDVGGTNSWEQGSAGDPFNANLEDLVFGPTGAYNTQTGVFTPYPAGMEGIPVHFNAQVTRNKWATAYVTFNNKTYPAKWAANDVTGMRATVKDYNGVTAGKVLGTGDPIPGSAFIPISDITGDIKNGRIRVTVREWNDEGCTDLNKEGTENFYTSVQNSKPTITYTYNRALDQMTVVATSAMSGIQAVTYQFDSGTLNGYTGPFPLGSPAPNQITLEATDNLGISTSLVIDVSNLGLLGNTAGTPATGTLTADAVANGTSASHTSNRAADIFIIGGTRGNTETVPGAQVFDNALN